MRTASRAGFTLPEMLIALTIGGSVSALGAHAVAQYRDATATERALRTIRSDVTLARSLAIKSRGPVSLVASDSLRTYVLRDTTGAVFQQRYFDQSSDMALTSLDVTTSGDSLTFDARGMLITGGTAQVTVVRADRIRSVTFNVLGRSQVGSRVVP